MLPATRWSPLLGAGKLQRNYAETQKRESGEP